MATDNIENLIGGQWRPCAQGTTFPNEDPSRKGSVLNAAQASGPEDVREAIAAAADASPQWRMTAIEERQELVGRFLDLLESAREPLARIVSQENGKTLRESRAEVDSALQEGRHHQRQVSGFFGVSRFSPEAGIIAWEEYYPVGVVAVISPWNYPVNVMCRKTLPALLTGNTVVFKPASFTPWSGVFMARLLQESRLPAGVFNCVTGAGAALGDALVRDPRVRAVSFTGSTAIGRHIQMGAATNLTRTQLELGGKNALIVMEDADIDASVEAAIVAGFGCAGQWCTSTSRILLHSAIADRFMATLMRRCDELVVGDPLDEKTDMGPVAGRDQYERISAAIERAKTEGARLLFGGASSPDTRGYFINPTVFDRVTPDMAIFREEVFGPVLAIARFDALGDALELTNRSKYGLSSAIFTSDLGHAMKCIGAVETGLAHVNLHTGFKRPALPFGGWKASGAGPPENGRTGLEFFVERKAVYMRSP